MNKTVLKYLSKITLDTNLDFANQTGLETLRVPAWREVNSIKRHEDLNDFICPKVYRCVSGEIKETLRNLPKDFTQKRGFRLTVKHISYNAPNAAETPILQILEPNDSSAAVYRRWCGSSLKGEWGKWYKSATHEDISAVQTHVSKMATDVQSFKERLRQLEKQVENADTIKHLTLRELELKTELKTARAELKKEKEKVALFQNSLSFRIGRVVTYVPRKLRALWHR